MTGIIDGAALDRARKAMDRAGRVICCVSHFGPGNEGNRLLRDEAERRGLLTDSGALLGEAEP